MAPSPDLLWGSPDLHEGPHPLTSIEDPVFLPCTGVPVPVMCHLSILILGSLSLYWVTMSCTGVPSPTLRCPSRVLHLVPVPHPLVLHWGLQTHIGVTMS